MKRLKSILLVAVVVLSGVVPALGQTAKVGTKVKPIKICDPSNNPVDLPNLGKKNLLIFYVDPDKANQNQEFREHLEKNQINSPNIYSFGIVNLKDAPLLPNGIVRAMIRKKVKQTGAMIYTDPEHLLRDGWNLGDVNDQFVLIFVNKACEIEFLSKGEISQAQVAAFYKVIEKYK